MTRWLLRGLAVLAILAFVGLGRWQLGRALEKETLLAANAHVLAARRPEPLAAMVEGEGRDLLWAQGHGRFLDAPALLLDNQMRSGRAGVRVYRAFLPEGAARAVLVDLGWLPLPGSRALPRIPRPAGVLELRGLLAPPPAVGLRLGPGVQPVEDGTILLATRVEPEALAAALRLDRPLASRVLRLDPALALPGDAPGYARDLDALSNTLPPDKHRGYALQWFALAAAVAVITLFLGFRRPSA